MGILDLAFTTTDGKSFTLQETVSGLPELGEEEIAKIYEDAYLTNAQAINQTKFRGNFKVTLKKIGFYNDSSGNRFFRADVGIENVGDITDYISVYDSALVVGNAQYERSYKSKLDASDLRPGVYREGYLLFEDVPLDISGELRIDVGSHHWVSKDYQSSFSYLYSFNVTWYRR